MINNEVELRSAWEFLKAYEKFPKTEGGKIVLAHVKKEIRTYYKNQAELPERRYFDCESAGYYRVFGVTDYESVAEAEEKHVPLTCYPDQLGRWFEISHKFFRRSDGKVCGYVWMAMNW